jgi:hypothetical protein
MKVIVPAMQVAVVVGRFSVIAAVGEQLQRRREWAAVEARADAFDIEVDLDVWPPVGTVNVGPILGAPLHRSDRSMASNLQRPTAPVSGLFVRTIGTNRGPGRSGLKGGGEVLKGVAHSPTVSLRAVIHTRDLLAQPHDGLGPEIVIPLGHTASRLGRLDAISPGRVVEVHHRALECKRLSRVGLDHLALRRPLVLTVAVVAVEGCADDGSVVALVPLAGMAFLGPFAHACHVRDGGVYQLGRDADVTGDLESLDHGAEFTTGTSDMFSQTLQRVRGDVVDDRYGVSLLGCPSGVTVVSATSPNGRSLSPGRSIHENRASRFSAVGALLGVHVHSMV